MPELVLTSLALAPAFASHTLAPPGAFATMAMEFSLEGSFLPTCPVNSTAIRLVMRKCAPVTVCPFSALFTSRSSV